MSYHQVATSPIIEKLFQYLQKSQWHKVSTYFSEFVRKEFEENLRKLEDDEVMYKNLKLMVDYSEMGRYSEAKSLLDPAYKDYQEMLNKLTEMKLLKVV